MLRRCLLVLGALTLLAVPALAKRSKVPALEAGVILAEPKAGAAKVIEVKKGENLLVLGKQGDWSNVQTDAGKKGWILSKTVSTGGLAALDPNSVVATAAEGDTAIAMRGRPNVPNTIVLGMGLPKNGAAAALGELLKAERKLKILEVRDEAATKTGSAAGCLAGATELAGKQPAQVVIAIQSATGDALTWEIVDLKGKAVLGTGTTTGAKPVEEVAAAVAKLTEPLLKNPAVVDATASSASSPAAVASPGATSAPAAAASPAPSAAPETVKKKSTKTPGKAF